MINKIVHFSVIPSVILKFKIWKLKATFTICCKLFGNVKRCFSCDPLRRVFVIPSANVVYSVSLLSFRMEKSLTCPVRCSYLPYNPKCNMKSYHCVFISERGEWQQNWSHAQSFSTSSLDRLLFGLSPRPFSRISIAFPSRTDRDDRNSL